MAGSDVRQVDGAERRHLGSRMHWPERHLGTDVSRIDVCGADGKLYTRYVCIWIKICDLLLGTSLSLHETYN